MTHGEARQAVLDAARRLETLGLNRGTSGNVARRVAGGLIVTPSGVPLDGLTAADMVFLGPGGQPEAHPRRPTSEWQLHHDIFANRPEFGAIVHTHSTAATALSTLREPIPAFHYMVAVAGGVDIRCARYETFGTPELSLAAVNALRERRAALLANHGVVACGSDLESAVSLAAEVEELARQYLAARSVGTPVLLDAVEMRRVLRKFEGYRQKAP